MIKATSIVTALGVTFSSFALAPAPANAGGGGGAVAGGIIGFAAGAIVGSQLNKNRGGTYRGTAPRRSQEEREYWMSIQDALNRIGYDAGPVDGAPGRRTRQAIREFQMSIPVVPDGKLTPEQTQLLFATAYPQAAGTGQPATNTAPANYPAQPGQGYVNPPQPGQAYANPPQPGTGQPGMGQPAMGQPGLGQPGFGQPGPAINQAQPVAPQQPVTAAATTPAPAAPAANGQPQVQVDEQGRQYIELNGQRFFLQQ